MSKNNKSRRQFLAEMGTVIASTLVTGSVMGLSTTAATKTAGLKASKASLGQSAAMKGYFDATPEQLAKRFADLKIVVPTKGIRTRHDLLNAITGTITSPFSGKIYTRSDLDNIDLVKEDIQVMVDEMVTGLQTEIYGIEDMAQVLDAQGAIITEDIPTGEGHGTDEGGPGAGTGCSGSGADGSSCGGGCSGSTGTDCGTGCGGNGDDPGDCCVEGGRGDGCGTSCASEGTNCGGKCNQGSGCGASCSAKMDGTIVEGFEANYIERLAGLEDFTQIMVENYLGEIMQQVCKTYYGR